MADEKDVLGKADALLRRHSVAAPRNGSETGGVPVLTDLIEEAPVASELPAQADIAQEVFTEVMREVEARLANVLERRLIEHLVPQLHAAVDGVLADLRQEIANAIGDAVARALERRPVK